MRALTTDDPVPLLLQEIAGLPSGPGRRLIAVAGPPASGKSTLAAALVAALNSSETTAALVPMDGFHLDNALLRDGGLLDRKGAPETFDAAGFVHAMRRLKSEPHMVLPSFDRHQDIAIAGAIEITERQRLVLVEGNYLCFDEDPWRALAGIWDFAVYLDLPEPVLERRLQQRWIDHGLSPSQATARAQSNDIPNARRVSGAVIGADLCLKIPGDG